MKLYRATPDQLGCLRDVTGFCEDAFYKLGYINDSSVRAFSLNDDFDFDPNPLYGRPHGKFFYKSPWDAVLCSEDMRGGFNLTRVLEYNFPAKIIDKSIRGFGLYGGRYVPEAKIPYEVLEKEGVIDTPLTPELENQLRITKLEILKETLELYKAIKMPSAEKVESILNDEGRYNRIHQLNINCLDRLIKCSYITGRTFPITRKQRIDMDDQGYEIIIDESNGVLTKKNYEEWNENKAKIRKLGEYKTLNGIDWKNVL
jgi:hypothetical protein